MKRLMVFVVGLVFLFTASVFAAADKPATAAPEKKEPAVAAPEKTEKKEATKKTTKKKVSKKKASKKVDKKEGEEAK